MNQQYFYVTHYSQHISFIHLEWGIWEVQDSLPGVLNPIVWA